MRESERNKRPSRVWNFAVDTRPGETRREERAGTSLSRIFVGCIAIDLAPETSEEEEKNVKIKASRLSQGFRVHGISVWRIITV